MSEGLNDVVHGVCEVSLTKQLFDNLLHLSKECSLVEAWAKARCRLVLVFCLPQLHVSNPLNELLVDLATQLHVSNPLNELLVDLATDVWNVSLKLKMFQSLVV